MNACNTNMTTSVPEIVMSTTSENNAEEKMKQMHGKLYISDFRCIKTVELLEHLVACSLSRHL